MWLLTCGGLLKLNPHTFHLRVKSLEVFLLPIAAAYLQAPLQPTSGQAPPIIPCQSDRPSISSLPLYHYRVVVRVGANPSYRKANGRVEPGQATDLLQG